MPTPKSLAALALVALTVSACGAPNRLKNVGQAPALSAIESPTAQPGYRPVQMPMPQPEPIHFASNSLWRTGSRAFFKDQRAARIGDILTVRVKITDKAEFENKTERSRTNSESLRRAEPVRPRKPSSVVHGSDEPGRCRLVLVERGRGLGRPLRAARPPMSRRS